MVRVIVLGGQSNGDGRGDPPYTVRLDNNMYMSKFTDANKDSVTLSLISEPTSDDPAAGGSMATALLNEIRTYYPDDILLVVNVSEGSTGLVNGSSDRLWNDYTTVGYPYELSIRKINLSLAAATALDSTVEILCYFWFQGEADSTHSTTKSQYISAEISLADQYRSDLSLSNMRFLAFQLTRYTNAVGTDAEWSGIRAAIAQFDSTGSYNHLAGVTLGLDMVDYAHLDTPGLEIAAQRGVNSLVNAIAGTAYRGPIKSTLKIAKHKKYIEIETNKSVATSTSFTGLYVANGGVDKSTYLKKTSSTTIKAWIQEALTVPTVGYLSKRNPDVSSIIVGTDSLSLPLEPFEYETPTELTMSWDQSDLVFAVLPYPLTLGGSTPSQFNSGLFPIYSPDDSVSGSLEDIDSSYGYQTDGYLNFSGADARLLTDATLSISNASIITIAAWVYITDNTTYNNSTIIGIRDDSDNNFQLAVYNDDEVQIVIRVGGTLRYARSSGELLNGWNYIEGVKDGATLTLHVNGVEVSYAVQNSYDLGDKTFTSHFCIGNRGEDTGNVFVSTNRIGLVSVYDNTRSAANQENDLALSYELNDEYYLYFDGELNEISSLEWDSSDLSFAILPYQLKLGSDPDQFNSGAFPVYSLDRSVTGSLEDVDSGFGYQTDGYLNFNGQSETDDRLLTNKIWSLSNTSKFTIVAWVYIANNATYNGSSIVGIRDDTNNNFQLGVYDQDNIQLVIRVGGTLKYARSSGEMLNGWNFLEAEKDGSTLTLRVNGNNVSYINRDTYSMGDKTYSSHFCVGNRGEENGNVLHAANRIGFVAIYDNLRSAANQHNDLALSYQLDDQYRLYLDGRFEYINSQLLTRSSAMAGLMLIA